LKITVKVKYFQGHNTTKKRVMGEKLKSLSYHMLKSDIWFGL
jgi:hypothetical protein